MKSLWDNLPKDMVNEDEGIFTYGEDVAYSFVCGNFSQGVKELKEYGVSTTEFSDYLKELADSLGCDLKDMFYGHFDTNFFICLARKHY